MKALLTGFALLLAASTALAADGFGAGPMYVGIGGGQSSFHQTCNYAAGWSPTAECDDEGVAAKVMLGLRVTKYAGLELSYIDAGEARVNVVTPALGTLEINPRLANLFVTFEIPIAVEGRLGVHAKVGMTYYDTQYTDTGIFVPTIDGEDGVTSALGAGISWRGWRHFSVRAEWEHFNDVGVRDGDMELVTVNVLFHF